MLDSDGPPRRGRPHKAAPRPLSEAEARRARAVIGRLRLDLAAVLARLGTMASTPSALARGLALDRASAHRLLGLASSARGRELSALAGAPGAEAIEAFLAAARRRGATAEALAAAAHALEQYRRLIAELAGSKAQLERRIAVSRSADGAASATPAARVESIGARLFEASAELLGRRTELRVDMMFVKRTPRRRDVFDYAQVRGILGHRAEAQALPLSIDLLGRVLRPRDPSAQGLLTLAGAPAVDVLSSALLREFCSDPLPVVLSQGRGDRVRNVVDARATGERGLDVVVGYARRAAFRHPRLEDVPVLAVGAMIREATERLLVDVYIEREVARGAVPDGEAYVWSPTLDTDIADHWLDRLPHAPPLTVLGGGLSRAASRFWPRHAELVAHAFGELGWDAEQFVGFRLEVERPLWGCSYFVVLDFAGARDKR